MAEIKTKNSAAAEALIEVVTNRGDMADRWIRDALTCAAATHSDGFLESLSASDKLPPEAIGIIGIVAEHHARSGRASTSPAILAAVENADVKAIEAIINGFAKGWKANHEAMSLLDSTTEQKLLGLFKKVGSGARGSLIGLAARWEVKSFEEFAGSIAKSYLDTVLDDQALENERITAAENLVDFRPANGDVVEDLLNGVGLQTPPAVSVGIVNALRKSTSPAVGESILKRIDTMTPTVKTAAMATLMQRAESVKAMLAAAEQGAMSLSELALDQRDSLLSHPDESIRRRTKSLLEKGGAMPNADRQKVIEEYLAVLSASGNVEQGQAVYKEQCSKCHIHGKMGVNIGPNLTGMAVHPKKELLTHILDPSRDVEANFRAYKAVTIDGVLITGMLASESKTTLELVDTQGKTQKLLREDVGRAGHVA